MSKSEKIMAAALQQIASGKALVLSGITAPQIAQAALNAAAKEKGWGSR